MPKGAVFFVTIGLSFTLPSSVATPPATSMPPKTRRPATTNPSEPSANATRANAEWRLAGPYDHGGATRRGVGG